MAAPRTTIESLPEKATASGTDLLIVQDGTVTKKMTIEHLYDGLGINEFTDSIPGIVPASGGGVANYLRADGTWSTPPDTGGTGGGGSSLIDGDYGDVTVGGTGTTMIIDSGAVTNAKLANMTNGTLKGRITTGNLAPEDLNATQVKAILAITQGDVSGLATALTGKANTSTAIPVTAPITGGGTLGSPSAIGINDFTVSARGAVPNPGGTSQGRFLKDDGTWAATPNAISGADGVFPYTYSTTLTEPPGTSQIRGNNTTFSSSTRLWITETTLDGLNVGLAMSRIKAGHQIYVQDYTDSTRWAIFNVLSDGTDDGVYWDFTVSLSSSSGTIAAGKVAVEALSPVAGTSLFSTTTTTPGLAPGSNGVGSTNFLRADGLWAVPAGGGGGGSLQVKNDNINVITTATGVDFGNGFDITATGTEAEVALNLGEYSGTNLPNAKVAGLGTLATKSTIVSADITDGTVALADMANLAVDRIIGRATAGTGVPEAITCTAAGRALIDDADTTAQRVTLGLGNVDNTADVAKPLFSTVSTARGLVPGSAGATSSFLRGDGTWAPVSGGSSSIVSQPNPPSDTSVLWADTDEVGIEENVRYISNVSSIAYTLSLADRGKLILASNVSSQTITIPLNSSVAFVVGTQLDVVQMGTGLVTISPASAGVTINATPSTSLRARYSGVSLIKIGTDTWLLMGDLA